MRALVVEDDPIVAREVVRALSAAGFVVDHAGDGTQAWFLGDVEDYDVAVVDLGLPRLDGLSVIRRWRDAERRFPILILSGYRKSKMDDILDAHPSIRAVIAKPIDAASLSQHIHSILQDEKNAA